MNESLNEYINNFFFLIYPHIALTVFWVGVIYTLRKGNIKTFSSTFFENKTMRWAANMFHIGIISVFAGHLFGLLTPEKLYHMILDTDTKRWLAISMGGFFGTIAVIGMAGLIYRRFTNPHLKATNLTHEIIILFLLLIEIVLGLSSIESTAHESIQNYKDLGLWSQAIVTFQHDAYKLIEHHNIIYKIHIVIGLSIFALTPFTKLMHIFVVPLSYIFRKGYQIVRQK